MITKLTFLLLMATLLAVTCVELDFMPQPVDNQSAVILYDPNNYESIEYWTNELEKFLEPYRIPHTIDGAHVVVTCSLYHPPQPGQVCGVDVNMFSTCVTENKFNYHRGSPCVFLKMNPISEWIPAYYNTTEDLPNDMPLQLKNHIAANENRYENPRQSRQNNYVWVSCEGEYPSDIENMGPIQYIPNQGFPGYYYPYVNAEGYLNPLVAVYFEQPARGVLINIRCQAWARDIRHDGHERIGSVHFELLIG